MNAAWLTAVQGMTAEALPGEKRALMRKRETKKAPNGRSIITGDRWSPAEDEYLMQVMREAGVGSGKRGCPYVGRFRGRYPARSPRSVQTRAYELRASV